MFACGARASLRFVSRLVPDAGVAVFVLVLFMFYSWFVLLRRFVLAVYSHYVVVCKCAVCQCCDSAK
jgi:hypothetical protein